MEFYEERIAVCRPEDLQAALRIDNLPAWCASVERVLHADGETGSVWTVWGEFRIRREAIRQGVRFTLPGCPNALQWTVTTEREARPLIRVHLTINRRDHDGEFIASIERFVAEACDGAVRLLGAQ